jgi:carbon monoxide dehydrogenase subunit G
MRVDGSFKLKAPIQKAWDVLLEPGTLASCVPGAEKIEAVDDKTYKCLVKQSVGPISVKLNFTVVLTEIREPNYVKASGRGEAMGKLGTFTMELTVNLDELADNDIDVKYATDIAIVGKLATFGERIMRAKGNKIIDEFTSNLQKKLEEIED